MKLIKVQHDQESDQHYLKLDDFSDQVDITKVVSYSLEPIDDCGDGETTDETKALILKFYDVNGDIIQAKGT